jgi:hypothetical protein
MRQAREMRISDESASTTFLMEQVIMCERGTLRHENETKHHQQGRKVKAKTYLSLLQRRVSSERM